MATPIMMPKQGQSVETCVINKWLKKKGDVVNVGDILFAYETDKASFEFESPVAGAMLDTFFGEGDDVPVMVNVAAIGNAGEDAAQFRPSGSAVPSVVKDDASVAAQPSAPVAAAQSSMMPPIAVPASTDSGVSPRARMRAGERGVDLSAVSGTGPAGRIIERDVLAQPAATKTAQARAAATGLSTAAPGTGIGGKVRSADLVAAIMKGQKPASVEDTVTEVKMSNIRKLIGSRMMESLQKTAQLTMNASADATALLEYRKQVKARAKDLGLADITVTDLVAMAVARTLVRFPELNCLYKDEKVLQYSHVHLAMAVDTPRGLMVPVVKFADMLGTSDLATALKTMAQQCKEGSINPDLLAGGTLTISNLGMFGIESFTPILNPPQVAIVGVNAITPKAKQIGDGEFVLRPHIGFSLTIDHRVVDGGPGARFLKALCDAVENIGFMLSVW
jgi:pyruvate dehydrogenase E2 component (dihydrolipoamide acetyltransferase)